MTTADGWTISEALDEFERAGMPVDAARFRVAVTRVARTSETASGPKGGRGEFTYPISQLQRLHAALTPWLTVQVPTANS